MKQLTARVGVYSLLLIASIYSTISVAQSRHEGLYQVEMVVFARKNANTQEQFPDTIKLRYPNPLEQLRDAPTDTIDANNIHYIRLDDTQKTLSSAVNQLKRNEAVDVLFHESWQQPITSEKNSRNIVIAGGPKFGDHFTLEGSIKISVATYLKLSTNLWHSEFSSVPQESENSKLFELPPRPLPPKTIEELEKEASLDTLFEQNTNPLNETSETTITASNQPVFQATNVILMQQSRDMKSDEVHYIDHPILGVVVKVTPVKVP
jgi:hypothetical protein